MEDTRPHTPRLRTGRLEAFSDGVIAILITIMVLELHVPHGDDLAALLPLWPVLLSYILSFIYLGIYWNNHHHLLAATQQVNGAILWANLHLLFWLSLIPFVTGWMGENNFAILPVACYGVVLLMSAIAYKILQTVLICETANRTLLQTALGQDLKGKLSILLYGIGIGAAFYVPAIAGAIYVAVALWWLVPDRRIEKTINHS